MLSEWKRASQVKQIATRKDTSTSPGRDFRMLDVMPAHGDRPVHIRLASSSPRRAQILRDAGYSIYVAPSPLDEPPLTDSGPSAASQAEAISYFKARSSGWDVVSDVTIGADTVVSSETGILGKPRDLEHAESILSKLMGTTHSVITGVALIGAEGAYQAVGHDRTDVTMRTMSPDELHEYLKSGLWEGKAGAYGIQDHGDRFVERIDGSYSNVVGLPMELFERMIDEWTHRQRADHRDRT